MKSAQPVQTSPRGWVKPPFSDTWSCVPVSHLLPVKPGGHLQTYEFKASTQVAWFKHGLESQSLMFTSQFCPVYPVTHRHLWRKREVRFKGGSVMTKTPGHEAIFTSVNGVYWKKQNQNINRTDTTELMEFYFGCSFKYACTVLAA